MGRPSRPTAPGKPAPEPAGIDPLEQTVSLEGPMPAAHESYGLDPAPIPRAWVLDGEPLAREKSLARSSDGTASVHMWDCTCGRFRWKYSTEEIVHVLEGCAIVEVAGVSRRLRSGDTHLFPAGSHFYWTVPDYVRTVTFRRRSSDPLRRRLQAALGARWRGRRARSTPI